MYNIYKTKCICFESRNCFFLWRAHKRTFITLSALMGEIKVPTRNGKYLEHCITQSRITCLGNTLADEIVKQRTFLINNLRLFLKKSSSDAPADNERRKEFSLAQVARKIPENCEKGAAILNSLFSFLTYYLQTRYR